MGSGSYEKELRIGLVLYGGVSLCIYIFGVIYEFLRFVRKEGIYKELLDDAKVKPVIDVISGSSAGGINGLFLAKALSAGADLEPLKNLWIEEGDLEKLIDKKSEPLSLLDSIKYRKLIEGALEKVDENTDGKKPADSDILDLFITATDLDGISDEFSDAIGNTIKTKQYNAVFNFKIRPQHYPYSRYTKEEFAQRLDKEREGQSISGDEKEEQNAFLAKVAAATSAFPLAFTPVFFSAKDKEDMRRLFGPDICGSNLVKPSVYGDGGIVNNRPFDYTIKTIFRRQADHPVMRKLFYVEPDPRTHVEEQRLAKLENPPVNGLDSLFCLANIKMHESITVDLCKIKERNQKIHELREITDNLHKSLHHFLIKLKEKANGENWRNHLRELYESQPLHSFYHSIKIRELQKKIGIKHSKQDRESEANFLMDVDYPFRIRRIRYFIDLINRWFDSDRELSTDACDVRNNLLKNLQHLKGGLYACIEYYLHGHRRIRKHYLQEGKSDKARDEYCKLMKEGPKDEVLKLLRELEEYRQKIEKSPEDSPSLEELFDAFEFIDMHLYPACILASVGEAEPIETVRVSPDAATYYKQGDNVVEEKLAGEMLMHFSAFLKQTWRENDLIWGRLDAAEVIARTLVSDSSSGKRKQKSYIKKLGQNIIQEELDSILKRRKTEIHRLLLSSLDDQEHVIKGIMKDLNEMKKEDSELFFHNEYQIGSETFKNVDPGYLIKVTVMALRTFGRLLNLLPKRIEAKKSGSILGNALNKIIKWLNRLIMFFHFFVVNLGGYKNPLLLIVGLLVLLMIVLYFTPIWHLGGELLRFLKKITG